MALPKGIPRCCIIVDVVAVVASLATFVVAVVSVDAVVDDDGDKNTAPFEFVGSSKSTNIRSQCSCPDDGDRDCDLYADDGADLTLFLIVS